MKNLAFVVAAAAAAFPSAAHADCAMIEMVDKVATPPQSALPLDGGVVITRGGRDPDVNGKAHAVAAKDWKVVDGAGKPVDVKIETLAPGLQRLVRTKAPKAGDKLVIKDDTGELGSWTYADGPKLGLKAPTGKSGQIESTHAMRGTRTTFSVDVDSIPDEASFAIVLENDKPIGATSLPHDKQDATTIMPYSSGGHCGGATPGQPPGGAFKLEWTDRFGRVGPVSSSVSLKPKA